MTGPRTGTDVEVLRAGKWLSVRRLKVPLTRQDVLRETTLALVARDSADGVLAATQAEDEKNKACTGTLRALPPECSRRPSSSCSSSTRWTIQAIHVAECSLTATVPVARSEGSTTIE